PPIVSSSTHRNHRDRPHSAHQNPPISPDSARCNYTVTTPDISPLTDPHLATFQPSHHTTLLHSHTNPDQVLPPVPSRCIYRDNHRRWGFLDLLYSPTQTDNNYAPPPRPHRG